MIMENGLDLAKMLCEGHVCELFDFGQRFWRAPSTWLYPSQGSGPARFSRVSLLPSSSIAPHTGSFRVAMLSAHPGGRVLSAAVVRVLGPKMAEIPLVATRPSFRRQGFCRMLMQVTGDIALACCADAADQRHTESHTRHCSLAAPLNPPATSQELEQALSDMGVKTVVVSAMHGALGMWRKFGYTRMG